MVAIPLSTRKQLAIIGSVPGIWISAQLLALSSSRSRKNMDYSPIVAQVWGMLTWFIPAALLIGLLKSPWAKGQIGELLVRLFAHLQLDKRTYRRLHNFPLNKPDGTMQIVHDALSLYGIFSFEKKNLSGWILGSEK